MVYLDWKGGLNSIFVDDENTSQGGGTEAGGRGCWCMFHAQPIRLGENINVFVMNPNLTLAFGFKKTPNSVQNRPFLLVSQKEPPWTRKRRVSNLKRICHDRNDILWRMFSVVFSAIVSTKWLLMENLW